MAGETGRRPSEKGVAGWNASEGAGRVARRGERQRRSVADRRRRIVAIAFVVIACIGCIALSVPIQEKITRGLWFKGGTATTMKAEGDVSSEDLSTSVQIIKKRLGDVGVSEYSVETSGSDTVVIKLPWNCDGPRIAESVGGTGTLQFVRTDEIGDADALTMLNTGAKDISIKDGTYTAFLDESHIKSCETSLVGDGVYAVTIFFDDEGAKIFADVTEELAKDYGSIAIVVNGKIVSSPTVSEKIEGGQVSISGGFTLQEAGALKAVIDTGKLPIKLKMQGSEEIGPLAGKTVVWGMVVVACAIIVGTSIMAIMRWNKLGWLVFGTQVVMAILMIGFMAIASRIEVFVLSISSLLGGAFACGCGIACAWMLVAHFRKSVDSGKSIRGSSLSAAGDALGPVAMPLAAVSVVSLVMLFLPLATLHDFGLSVALGIIASIVAVLLFEVPLLRVLATGAIQENPTAWGIVQKSNDGGVTSEQEPS